MDGFGVPRARWTRALRLNTACGPGRRTRCGLVAGLILVGTFALTATNAAAVIVQAGGSTVSYLAVPTPGGAKGGGSNQALEYHGGPVMPSNTNYPLYWAPGGASEYPSGYETGIDRYFEDLAHDSGGLLNTDGVLTQYGDNAGEFANYNSHFGGALSDTHPFPASGCSAAPICLTQEQLRSEITAFVEAQGLPIDLQHEYFVLTPPGVESCLEAAGHACSAGTKHAAYCAYHGFVSSAKGVIVFANDPYVAGLNCDVGEEHPNNNVSDATIAGGLAHEHSESITDPQLNAWYDVKKREVADKCRTLNAASEYGEPLGTAPDGANYNQVLNGDLYLYQQMWSNNAGECEQRPMARPTVKKLSPRAGHAAGGTTVNITGSNFTSPATVKFASTPATGVLVNSATSITAVSPAGARGTVDVTVTTSAGTSAVTKKDHFKYKK
jgi:hypothetical protein